MTGINIALEDTVLLGVFRKRSAKLLRWETRPHTGIHPHNYFTSFEHWGRTPKVTANWNFPVY